jgi:type I restriction enzyme, S subunit
VSGPWQIPANWRWSTMGDVAAIVGGGTPKSDQAQYFGGDISWITPADLSGYKQKFISAGARNITQAGLDNSGAKMMPTGSVLFSSRAPIGYVVIAANPISTSQGFKSFVLRDCLTPDFVYYYLQHAKKLAVEMASGTTFLEISGKKAAQLPIPVAPLSEQRRIVAEIEKQFTRLDAGVAALRRVQANLKRYRAAVLKAACEGRLVPIEAAWHQASLKDLIGDIGQGWSPKCLTRDVLPNEWAVITTTAVQSMRYIDNQGKPLPSSLEPRPRIEIKAGDFLMTRKGPRKRAGVACLVRSTRPRLMVCDTVYRFRCDESRVMPAYLEIALNSPFVVDAIDREKAGISESGVSLTHDKLGTVSIPVPPHNEQRQIVSEVERRLSVIDELEAVVSTNLRRANSLRQSILQKAFAGK